MQGNCHNGALYCLRLTINFRRTILQRPQCQGPSKHCASLMRGIEPNATAAGIRTVLNGGPTSTTQISLIGHADDTSNACQHHLSVLCYRGRSGKGAVQLFLCKSVEDVPKVKGKGDDQVKHMLEHFLHLNTAAGYLYSFCLEPATAFRNLFSTFTFCSSEHQCLFFKYKYFSQLFTRKKIILNLSRHGSLQVEKCNII